MPRPISKQRLFTLGSLITAVALVGACGGRAVIEDSSGGGASAGTHSSNGGTSSAHGGGSSFSGSFGVSGGSTSFAGSPSVAGATSSGGCSGAYSCPAIACEGNRVPVRLPGQCCPVCQLLCPGSCIPTMCPDGYVAAKMPDNCCPVCIPNVSCEEGRMAYQASKDMLASKYAFGCRLDSDCVAVSPTNSCETGCSYTAISESALTSWQSNLDSFASMDCASCAAGGPPPPIPPCEPPPPPRCLAGQCTFDLPP